MNYLIQNSTITIVCGSKIFSLPLDNNIDKIKSFKTEEDIESYLNSLRKTDRDFVIKDELHYIKGINIPLPQSLYEKLDNAYGTKDYQKYYNFWVWLSKNPNKRCIEDLMTYLDTGEWILTKYGYVVAFRRILSVDKTPGSHYETIQKYHNLKKKKKKSSGWLEKYNEAISQCEFTTYHDSTYRIKIGHEVREDRNSCNEDNSVCHAGGLHVCNRDFDYSSFGDTEILVFVNPKDWIATPITDSGKARVAAYFPVRVIESRNKYGSIKQELDEYHLEQLKIESKCLADQFKINI